MASGKSFNEKKEVHCRRTKNALGSTCVDYNGLKNWYLLRKL